MLSLKPIVSHPPSSSPIFLPNSSSNFSQFSTRISSGGSERRPLHRPPRSAFEEEKPQHLEFDKDKARKALQQLDQQLQSLAEQQEAPKSRRPSSPYSYSDPNVERDVMIGIRSTEEMPEISRSYLSYAAVALLILTIFNNIIFNVFIKPSIDGKEQATPIERVPLKEP